jgi:hypothetical protein
MIRLIKITGIFLFLMALTVIMLSSCESDEDEPLGHQVTEIAIEPDNASFGVGEELKFSAFALTAAGDTVNTDDLDIVWEWWSTDPDVFTVEPGGLATGHNPGEAFCVIEAVILAGTQNFTGRDSAFVLIF